MEKQKKWQLFLILAVVALTIYNILPTLFYYIQPLKKSITEVQANQISSQIETRVKNLEKESKEWIGSFCNLIDVKPQSIEIADSNYVVKFAKSEMAAKFRRFLPRAGSLISFVPAQLALAPQEENIKEVIVQRRIHTPLEQKYFSFAKKGSKEYRDLIIDRAAQVAFALTGPSEQAVHLYNLNAKNLETLALQINTIADLPSSQKNVANRFSKTFTQGPFSDRPALIKSLISSLQQTRDGMKGNKELVKKEAGLFKAESFLKKHEALFSSGSDSWTLEEIKEKLEKTDTLILGENNPLFKELTINWETSEILLSLHADVDSALLKQPLINEAAKVTRLSNESLSLVEDVYRIKLLSLADCSGFLLLDLEALGKVQGEHILETVKTNWHPKHQDLKTLSIVDQNQYETLMPDEKALSLVVHTPSKSSSQLFLAANGFDQIQKTYAAHPNSELAQDFNSDFRSLITLLQQSGYQPYQGRNQEIIFEQPDPYQSILAATREKFEVKGTKKYAALELSNLEHRLIAENHIDTEIHNDLIKWNDEYNSSQVSLNQGTGYDVPKPTKSILLNNTLLSFKKMFRGDEKKIIRWGLDLSGGKTVQIELRDGANKLVKNEDDIKQGINELYNRVNKMGVSEVAIRQLGNNIVLDFPGSQSLSARELIKASSMYFHVVNEKFSSLSSPNAAVAQRFLQEVWNEAVVTNRKDVESIHTIAYRQLHGEIISETARTLLENGLALQSPEDLEMSNELDESTSKIAIIRSSDQWFGQTHPLLFVFNNYTLEGSQLASVQSNYDPQKGNYLSFDVQSSALGRNGQKINPRNNLFSWTSCFSKEKVLGTTLEEYSRGNGWRMAVILNGSVISAPTLDGVIRDSASISGHFSQREVQKLVADLKAGSLSFTPHILSEKNVSPELGQKDRAKGIMATIVALLLVIASMVIYYRFAGLVASIAVLFNLLILWATLQNIGATLSLAGIAGIILTVGMAVDANVLVFERVKEEYKVTKNLALSISAGYKKAYSAIIDSNVTTIIAALILLNFDAGPIKGFAITLIIGIVSSMFSALFMTRYFFQGWVQRNKGKTLNMGNWIRTKSIDFLKHSRFAMLAALLIIAVGGSLVFMQKSSILGMDFTGGFSLHLEVERNEKGQYLKNVEDALLSAGATAQDFQIRELNPENHLRILFGTSMEMVDKPFYNMPVESENHTNPRIDWVLAVLASHDLSLTDSSFNQIEKNWTAMSGQMSDSMRNNALLGLLVAFVCIFIYITFRFEYKFAAASILCVIHDVLITIALLGILHAFGVPVQIDLNTVAAIMTIVGYSLNDTIIIFDRIREEMGQTRNRSLPSIVNSALNATLSRTTITSLTTLLVLVALVVLGGSSIFSFALVMTIGVVLGTLSSWYIASPLMLFFHGKEQKEALKQTS